MSVGPPPAAGRLQDIRRYTGHWPSFVAISAGSTRKIFQPMLPATANAGASNRSVMRADSRSSAAGGSFGFTFHFIEQLSNFRPLFPRSFLRRQGLHHQLMRGAGK